MFIYTYVYIVQKRLSRPFRGLVTPTKWRLRRRFAEEIGYTTPVIFNGVAKLMSSLKKFNSK